MLNFPLKDTPYLKHSVPLHVDLGVVLEPSASTGPLVCGYGGRIARDEFDRTAEQPGFEAALAVKDVGHIIDMAASAKVPICTSMFPSR